MIDLRELNIVIVYLPILVTPLLYEASPKTNSGSITIKRHFNYISNAKNLT